MWFQFIAGYIRGLYNKEDDAYKENDESAEEPNNNNKGEKMPSDASNDGKINATVSYNTDNLENSSTTSEIDSDEDDHADESLVMYENLEKNCDCETDSHKSSDSEKDCILIRLDQDWLKLTTFCNIEFKWEHLPTGIFTPCDTKTLNETIMIPAYNSIAIIHIGNSVISHVHLVNCMNLTVEDVELPKRIEHLGSARFCLLNDEIFCFGRKENFLYHK